MRVSLEIQTKGQKVRHESLKKALRIHSHEAISFTQTEKSSYLSTCHLFFFSPLAKIYDRIKFRALLDIRTHTPHKRQQDICDQNPLLYKSHSTSYTYVRYFAKSAIIIIITSVHIQEHTSIRASHQFSAAERRGGDHANRQQLDVLLLNPAHCRPLAARKRLKTFSSLRKKGYNLVLNITTYIHILLRSPSRCTHAKNVFPIL